MFIHPSIMKEGRNNSASGFRSNQKLYQHAVHKRTATPYQMLTMSMASVQHGWNMKQKKGY